MTATLPLSERFRPAALEDLVGQEKAVEKLRKLQARGYGGRALYVTGKSGTGKTSAARIVALSVADPVNVVEYRSATELDLSELKALSRSLRFTGMGSKTGRAVIVNESHKLTPGAIAYLLGELEDIPAHVVWIFTTTAEANATLFADQLDADPFLSRCIRLELSQRMGADRIAEYVVSKMRGAGLLNGHPDAEYVAKAQRHLKDNGPNVRALWNAIDFDGLFDLG